MIAFSIPAVLAAGIAIIHVVAGGREIARPLLEQHTLPQAVILTHYYCWHMATIALIGLSGCYAYAAVFEEGRILATFATLIAAAFCIWDRFFRLALRPWGITRLIVVFS
ncbi:MAG: hypothetical protein ACNA7O_16395 [Rhodobacterales bacterium]